MTPRRATSQDVADLAGVSRSAVSLVLNGRADGMISAAKQEVIRAAARRLNYVPNAVALSLRTSKTSTIGVLADTLDTSPAVADTLLGAGTRAVQDGYLLLIIGLATTDGDEERAWEILGTRQVDGLIFVSGDLCERPSPELLRRLPSALANCIDTDGVVPGLVADEAAAIVLLVDHLQQHGHRDIAMITAPIDAPSTTARLAGYQRAMSRLSDPVPLATGYGISHGYAAGLQLLSGDHRPTAIIAASDHSAMGVRLAAAELGLAVPHDLSLVTIEEDQSTLSTMVPALTAVRQPYVQIGSAVVDHVLRQLQQSVETEPADQLMITGELITRNSVAAPSVR